MATRSSASGGARGTAGAARGAAPRIDPIESRLRWEVLSRSDMERSDAAVMDVLGQAREILRTHAPDPLPDDVRAELRRHVERAEAELV
jgi:hypothetical protein